MSNETSSPDTLHDIWASLPPRIPKSQGGSAVFGGVCEGIGARYRIDPVLVRLAFVTMALMFGGGIFVYLLFFLLMPRFGTAVSPWRAVNTPKKELDAVGKKDRGYGWWLLIGLGFFFPTISVSRDEWTVSSLFTVVLALAAVYLLHQRQPVPPEGLLVARPAPQDNSYSVDTSHLSAPEGYPHPGTTPPAWDPLGAAPGLWHLPDPGEPEPEPRKEKRGLGGILAAVAAFILVPAMIIVALGITFS